jgi:hypothetical protein
MDRVKVYVRGAQSFNQRGLKLWRNEEEREQLRRELNDLGFYVLTSTYDTLDVYAIRYDTESFLSKKIKELDKVLVSWYKDLRRSHANNRRP